MTFSKASRTSVLAALLCLLLMGFAGASYGAVRFSVGSSPTEVINTGMSEVTGSFNMNVVGEFNTTGSSSGGDAQIGIAYNAMGTHMTIDNTTSSGIKIFYTQNFAAASPPPTIEIVENISIAGICFGQITINIGGAASVYESVGDFIRVEGVRGRIATSTAVLQGADLYAALQSINDPAAYSFEEQDAIYRVARSYPGLAARVQGNTALLLCFPTLGIPPGEYPMFSNYIRVSEGFARAFVDIDANNDGLTFNDRVDSGDDPLVANGPGYAEALGLPDNSTHVAVALTDIPASVAGIHWPPYVYNGTSYLYLDGPPTFSGMDAMAVYRFETPNQVALSDLSTESWDIQPIIELGANQTDTGEIKARVALYPFESLMGCSSPENDNQSPDFAAVWQSDENQDNTYPGQNDPYLPYATIIRCNCYMLFSFVASTSGTSVPMNTGFAIANTSADGEVFGSSGAPDQEGPITYYFYDSVNGYVGSYPTGIVQAGQTDVQLLSTMLSSLGVGDFTGYVIAKAEFQYCHGVSYIADSGFATMAQGYAAMIIPDPSIKTGSRTASDAGDSVIRANNWTHYPLPAGESLNN